MAETKTYQDFVCFADIKLFIGDKIIDVEAFEVKCDESVLDSSIKDVMNILTCNIGGHTGMSIGPVVHFNAAVDSDDPAKEHTCWVQTLYKQEGSKKTYATAEFTMFLLAKEVQ